MDRQTIDNALSQTEGNVTAAARMLGVPRSTLRHAIARECAKQPDIEMPEMVDDDIPTEEIINQMAKRFEKRQAAYQQRQWMTYKIAENKPIGICWFGDPHVDSNGCNWTMLRDHCRIMSETPGLYGASIGDHTDNWVGRMTRLYANSDQSRSTAIRLVEWFIQDSGVDWMLLLRGNHDMWTNEKRDDPLHWLANNVRVPLEDWAARIKLAFPNGKEAKVWASHNFPGHSIWNTMHGPQRAAHTKAEAHLYICGHTHNWALHQEESASRDFTYWLARARGYKYLDEYADVLGHFPQQGGASIVSIIDPHATSESGFVQCFADVNQGARYLTWLRQQ